jgi:hypothetical protein
LSVVALKPPSHEEAAGEGLLLSPPCVLRQRHPARGALREPSAWRASWAGTSTSDFPERLAHIWCPSRPPFRARQEPGLGLWVLLSASTLRCLMWPSRRGPASHLQWPGPGASQSRPPLLLLSRTPTPFSLPPHLSQANASKSNVLLSHSA